MIESSHFSVECRVSTIKVPAQQSDGSVGKSSNPHNYLTNHYTCPAKIILARHNTQPLVPLNFKYVIIKKNFLKDVKSIINPGLHRFYHHQSIKARFRFLKKNLLTDWWYQLFMNHKSWLKFKRITFKDYKTQSNCSNFIDRQLNSY